MKELIFTKLYHGDFVDMQDSECQVKTTLHTSVDTIKQLSIGEILNNVLYGIKF